MFDFKMQHESLIAFQNDDQDELFKHYDDRNKTRLRKLRKKATITQNQTDQLLKMANVVNSILAKITQIGSSRGKAAAKKPPLLIDPAKFLRVFGQNIGTALGFYKNDQGNNDEDIKWWNKEYWFSDLKRV